MEVLVNVNHTFCPFHLTTATCCYEVFQVVQQAVHPRRLHLIVVKLQR